MTSQTYVGAEHTTRTFHQQGQAQGSPRFSELPLAGACARFAQDETAGAPPGLPADVTVAECLVDRYGDRAYRLAIGITLNALDAEEVIKDAFGRVVRGIDAFGGESPFGSWVYRVTANAAYQKLKSRANRPTEVSFGSLPPLFGEDGQHARPIPDRSEGADEPSGQSELRRALSSAMDELPPEYRAIVILRDVEGLSLGEVAESLGISVASARSRTHRARLFLRERLAPFMATSGAGVAGVGRPHGRGFFGESFLPTCAGTLPSA